MHNNGKDKTSVKEDLNRLSSAYAALKPDEPPHMLDQAILNSAHRAVAQKSRWLQFGWPHGLTTAAIVVLTFSIINMQYRPGVLDPQTLPEQEAVLLDQAHVKRQLETAREPQAILPAAKPVVKKSQEYRWEKSRVQESMLFKEVQVKTVEEQRLDAILALKYAGDDAWKTELTAFTRDFPDYPLPDVLKDKDQLP